jgi:hypothetical protein
MTYQQGPNSNDRHTVIDQMKDTDHACFEVVSVLPRVPEYLASAEAAKKGGFTVCTALSAALSTTPSDPMKLLESDWPRIATLRVRLGYGENATIREFAASSEPAGYLRLYGMAVADLKRRVVADFVYKEIPIIEAAIVVIAVLVWWAGRLTVMLGTWISRGFGPVA